MTTSSPISSLAVRRSAVALWLAKQAHEKVSHLTRKVGALLARAENQCWSSVDMRKEALGAARRAVAAWEKAASDNMHLGSVQCARAYLVRATDIEANHSQGTALKDVLSFFDETNAESLAEVTEPPPVPLGTPIPFVPDRTSVEYYVENSDEIPRQVGRWRLICVHEHASRGTAALSRCVTCRHERSSALSEYLRTNPGCPACKRRERDALTAAIAVGTKFGNLTTVTLRHTQGTALRWSCRCSCKRVSEFTGTALLSGKYTECRTCRKSSAP